MEATVEVVFDGRGWRGGCKWPVVETRKRSPVASPTNLPVSTCRGRAALVRPFLVWHLSLFFCLMLLFLPLFKCGKIGRPKGAPLRVNVPINVPVNERQQWFLEQLSASKQTKATDISEHWKVTEKSAKRDITDLKARGVIEFVGAPRNGFYRVKG